MRLKSYLILAAATAGVAFSGLVVAAGLAKRRSTPAAQTAAGPGGAAPVRAAARPSSPADRGPGAAPPVAALPSMPVVDGDVFHSTRVTPYFRGGPAAEAVAKLRLQDWGGAIKALGRAIAAPRAPHPGRLRFLLAYALMRNRAYGRAGQLFEQLRVSYQALALYSTFYAARCRYFSHDPAESLRLARLTARLGGGDSPLARRAMLLEGDALRALKRWPEAAKTYESFVARYRTAPSAVGLSEARYRLAELLLRQPSPPTKRIAALLREVSGAAPKTTWDTLAAKLRMQLLQRVRSRRQRWLLGRTSCDHQLERARRLATRRRVVDATRAYREAVKLWRSCSPSAWCRAAAAVGREQLRRRKRWLALRTLGQAAEACRRARQTGLLAKTLYYRARAYKQLGYIARAQALYRRIERQHREHSYADDARYRAATLWLRRGQRTRAVRMLRTLPKTYPAGDKRYAALWQLAWEAYGRRDWKRALVLLGEGAALAGAPPRVEVAGQFGYWQGRLLERRGRVSEAVKVWEHTARRFPLTYYAMLSLVRLKSRAPGRLRAFLEELSGRPRVRWSGRLGPDPVFGKAGFQRAVELARLGMGELAHRELRRLGISSPKPTPADAARGITRKAALAGTPEAKRLWAAVVLYDRAGLHHRSHWIARHALRSDYANALPTGQNWARWRIAFPKAYDPLIRTNASKRGVPPSLVFGLMREESAFNPRLVSHANAVGLMQLLVSTARRFADKGAGRIDATRLKKATLNVPIGANYLGWLYRLFQQHLVPTIAAYNAGETNVSRWLVARGHLPVDEFVEHIPFRETRNYVKRVLGSAFAYNALAGEPDPVFALPLSFSAKLRAEAKAWREKTRRWARWRRRQRRRLRRRRPRRRPGRRGVSRRLRRRPPSRPRPAPPRARRRGPGFTADNTR